MFELFASKEWILWFRTAETQEHRAALLISGVDEESPNTLHLIEQAFSRTLEHAPGDPQQVCQVIWDNVLQALEGLTKPFGWITSTTCVVIRGHEGVLLTSGGHRVVEYENERVKTISFEQSLARVYLASKRVTAEEATRYASVLQDGPRARKGERPLPRTVVLTKPHKYALLEINATSALPSSFLFDGVLPSAEFDAALSAFRAGGIVSSPMVAKQGAVLAITLF